MNVVNLDIQKFSHHIIVNFHPLTPICTIKVHNCFTTFKEWLQHNQIPTELLEGMIQLPLTKSELIFVLNVLKNIHSTLLYTIKQLQKGQQRATKLD